VSLSGPFRAPRAAPAALGLDLACTSGDDARTLQA